MSGVVVESYALMGKVGLIILALTAIKAPGPLLIKIAGMLQPAR